MSITNYFNYLFLYLDDKTIKNVVSDLASNWRTMPFDEKLVINFFYTKNIKSFKSDMRVKSPSQVLDFTDFLSMSDSKVSFSLLM